MPKTLQSLTLDSLMLMLAAWTPTVQVAVPNEPSTSNRNGKIKHGILVKVDKEIENLVEENSELF